MMGSEEHSTMLHDYAQNHPSYWRISAT